MKTTIFTGSGVAIVTPMNPDGSVNYDSFARLIDFQLENQTDAIIACGTTGESATLSHEEHVQVIRFVAERVAGRVPVIAGTGSNDTAYSLELSQEAKNVGADALLLLTPYYNKTSQAGLISHFTYVADRVDLPVMLYNVPSRTAIEINPATYLELSKHPRIVAIKEAGGKFSAIAQTMHLCGDTLDLYSGNDDQIVPLMSLGAKGVVSVLANVMPAVTHQICAEYLAGNVRESLALQLRYLPLANALFCDVSPMPVKDALNQMGFGVGSCRLPLVSLSQTNSSLLRAEMKNAGLI